MSPRTPARVAALTGCLACALLVAQPALAAEDVGKWYLAPSIYGTWLSDAKRADDDPSYGLAFGRNLSPLFSAEVGWQHGSFDGAPGTSKLKLDAYSLDGLWHFYRESTIHPYLTAGLTYVDGQRSLGPKGSGSGFQAGLGLMTTLYTNAARTGVVQLRGEIRNRWTVRPDGPDSDWQSDTLAGLGVVFNFGRATPLPVEPIAAEEPAPVVEAPKDSDGDGVVDPNDRCPDTPAGAKVDANGCELDSDGDGVVDRLDRCPGTPPGIKVDANGCEIEEIVLRGVVFDTDKATLTPASQQVLDSMYELLRTRGDAKIEIRGHTDDVGKDAYNQALSERRAQAVVDYLVRKGLKADNIHARGFGESQPIASNATAEGRAQNRRVTLQFTEYAKAR